MSFEELVVRLSQLGVRLSKRDGQLSIKAPPGGLDPDQIAEIQTHKERLLSFLPSTAQDDGIGSSTTANSLKPDYRLVERLASTSQQRLHFLQRLKGDNAYNLACTLKFGVPMDHEKLGQFLVQLVERHEPLRTAFEEFDGECRPRPLPSARFVLKVVHISESELPSFVRAVVDEPFRLVDEIPVRGTLFIDELHRCTLVICFHHLAIDGWSLLIFLDELGKLIAGERLPPLEIDYARWAHAERDEMATPEFSERLQWWVNQLRNIQRFELWGSADVGDWAAKHVSSRLSPSLTRQIQLTARRMQTTPFAVFAATVSILLARCSNTSEVAIATAVANRSRPGAGQLVGLLANTVVLRCSVHDDPNIEAIIRQITATTFESLARPDVPLDRIISALQLPRTNDANPLFQFMLVLQPELTLALPNGECKVDLCPPATAKFDLTLTLIPSGDELLANLEYRANRFSDDFARDLLNRFVSVLRDTLHDTKIPLSKVPTIAEIVPYTPLDREVELGETQNRRVAPFRADTDRLIEIEHRIRELWQALLGIKHVGSSDDFFELGGHSLLAMRLAGQLSRCFGVDFPIAAVFEAPRLHEQAAIVAEATPGQSVIKKSVDPEVPHTLSSAQERLWTLEHIEKPGASYNLGKAVHLSGKLNVAALTLAVDDVVERHRILGVRFHQTDGRPSQSVNAAFAPQLEVFQISSAETEHHIADTLWSPFAINNAGLVRIRLFTLSAEEQVLAMCMHHAVGDGWSIEIFNRELSIAYGSRVLGSTPLWSPLAIQYADFAVWQRQEELENGQQADDLAYWQHQLADLPEVCTLPADFRRPEYPSHKGERTSFVLPTGTVAKLRRLAHELRTSPFTILLAAFAVVLSRFRLDNEIVLGSPFAGRIRPDLEPLIGCFVNTLVLRVKVKTDASFSELVSDVKAIVVGAHRHQNVAFEKIVDVLKTPRATSHSQVFQILFAMDMPDSGSLELPGLKARVLPNEHPTAKYDLNIHFQEHGTDVLNGYVEYAVDLFEGETVARFIDSLQTVLAQVTDQPQRPVGEVEIMSRSAKQELKRASTSRTAPEVPTNELVHDLFAQQVLRTPQAIALELGNETWTYSNLARRTNQLAHYFQSVGAAPDVPVAIMMGRSMQRVAVLLGVLTAGAPYLPMSVDTPVERNRQILAHARPALLVVDDSTVPAALNFSGNIINLGKIWHEIEALPAQGPNVEITPDHLAYILFTSGTLGSPKGVMVPHRGVAHDIRFLIDYQELRVGHRTLQVTEYTFDPSVRDLFATLGCGATAVLLKDHEAQNPLVILDKLTSKQITHVLSLTPTMLSTVCATGMKAGELSKLEVVMLNGEPLRAGDVRLARECFGDSIRIFNQYGPTETTMTSSVHEVTEADLNLPRIPVGPPHPNTQIRILDEVLRPVPLGVFGEVFISGIGVARGYLADPQRTDQCFVSLPDSKTDQVWYRTGDIGRWLSNGTLDLCGRRDSQIKLRGNRIEVSEVEECLMSHPLVSGAAAAVKVDSRGLEHLVAYLVIAKGARLDPAIMRVYLSQFLPRFMMPSMYLAMERLPYTATGKLDRQRLPNPTADILLRTPEIRCLPVTPTEKTIANLWKQVLPPLTEIDCHANFFDIGGNSLLLIQLHTLITNFLERDDSIVELFRRPTIAAYAAFLDGETTPRIGSDGEDRLAKRQRRMSSSFPAAPEPAAR